MPKSQIQPMYQTNPIEASKQGPDGSRLGQEGARPISNSNITPVNTANNAQANTLQNSRWQSQASSQNQLGAGNKDDRLLNKNGSREQFANNTRS